jgi:hypothetical protein
VPGRDGDRDDERGSGEPGDDWRGPGAETADDQDREEHAHHEGRGAREWQFGKEQDPEQAPVRPEPPSGGRFCTQDQRGSEPAGREGRGDGVASCLAVAARVLCHRRNEKDQVDGRERGHDETPPALAPPALAGEPLRLGRAHRSDICVHVHRG